MINFTIKSSDVIKSIEEKLKKRLEEDLKNVVKTLGDAAIKHAEKLSQENLPGSLSDIYKNNLYIEQISDNVVEVGIREEALFIEEGRKSGFMDELLTQKSGSDVKTSKEGHKYRIIPFEHSTSGKGTPSTEKDNMVSELKNFLRSQNVRYSKTRALEVDESGSPRIGKIHSFNIKDMKASKRKSVQGLSKNLQGVAVYQNENPQTGKVERNIMTFRVISEKSKDSGKWEHPGRPPENILDQTYEHIKGLWEKDILPELRKKYE